jgi:hypothetical protein
MREHVTREQVRGTARVVQLMILMVVSLSREAGYQRNYENIINIG